MMILKICERCKKQFMIFPCRSKQRFCSRSCSAKGKHPITAFTSERIKQLWQDEKYRRKVLKSRATSIAVQNHNKAMKGRKRPTWIVEKMRQNFKGSGNPFFGCHHSLETKRKLSIFAMNRWAKIPPEKRKFTEEHKRKIGRSGERNPMYGKPNPNRNYMVQFKSAEFQAKRLRGLHKRPTRPEAILIRIIERYSLPFEYVGDGTVMIEGLNPDFISSSNKHKIVEVFGEYWHKEIPDSATDTENGRKEFFGNIGYDCLIIWDHELYNTPEPDIANRIIAFNDKVELRVQATPRIYTLPKLDMESVVL